MAFTSKITGGDLEKWVQTQIKLRQQVIGNNPEVADLDKRVLANHNKGAWVRLASSADITSYSKSKDLSSSDSPATSLGNGLAKKYTLLGGVNFDPSTNLGGVFDKNSNIKPLPPARSYSYGIGDAAQGYQPIPGIESVNIRHINKGAVRTFEIRLKVHSKIQFNIIEALYLRLGYYMLLEWGHTTYINNEGEFVSNPQHLGAYTAFMEEGKNPNEVSNEIYNQKRESGGNYDGALVKIINFNWSLETDGSYSIILKGIGKGGLIDSLTLNYPGTSAPFPNYFWVKPSDEILKKVTEFYKDILKEEDDSDLTHYVKIVSQKAAEGDFEKLKELGAITFKQPDEGEIVINYTNETSNNPDDDNIITITNQRKSSLNKKLFDYHLELKNIKEWEKDVNGKERFKNIGNDIISVKFDNPKNDSEPEGGAYEYNYITLGLLLANIQQVLKESNDNIKINIDSQYGENFMFTHWFQHSADPGVCLIPFTYYDKTGEEHKVFFKELSSPQLTPSEDKFIETQNFRQEKATPLKGNERFQGKIMHIYVNIEHIAKVLDRITDPQTGEVSLYKLLYDLTGDITYCLGSINNLNVTYAPEEKYSDGKLQIKDDTIVPGIPELNDSKVTKLRLYGTQPNVEGSFVTNVSSDSQVSSKMATQLSIGAVASGVNSSTVLLSRFNEGIEDRIQNAENKTNSSNEKIIEELNEAYDTHLKFIEDVYIKFQRPSQKRIETAKSNLKQLLEYDLAIQTLTKKIAGKGFIPINLSIEMQGLAGILLYQRIVPTEEILPSSYTDQIDFIALSLDHSIQGNTWTTTVNTQSVPKLTDRGTTTGKGGVDLRGGLTIMPYTLDSISDKKLETLINNVKKDNDGDFLDSIDNLA